MATFQKLRVIWNHAWIHLSWLQSIVLFRSGTNCVVNLVWHIDPSGSTQPSFLVHWVQCSHQPLREATHPGTLSCRVCFGKKKHVLMVKCPPRAGKPLCFGRDRLFECYFRGFPFPSRPPTCIFFSRDNIPYLVQVFILVRLNSPARHRCQAVLVQ